ncbi:helix-turn-helix transcriptional regulator [Nonomuraea sp. NPDC003201]
MTSTPASTRSNRLEELGDFLRQRRDTLTPLQAGLPSGGRRRAPGLRRDEVAALAHMSVTYYERLEQGRGPQPSAAMLAGLTMALQLNDDERDHLYRLAGQASPVAPDSEGYVDPGLLSVLRAVEATTPGYIADDLGTVVAQNTLNLALFGRFTGLPGWEGNLVWRWFTSPRWRFVLEPEDQHEQTGRAYVADLRAIVAQREHDETAAALVADLRTASAEFVQMWEEHQVSALHCSTKHVDDERVGLLDLECAVVTSPLSRQRMLLLFPLAGTDTALRLERLSALVRG